MLKEMALTLLHYQKKKIQDKYKKNKYKNRDELSANKVSCDRNRNTPLSRRTQSLFENIPTQTKDQAVVEENVSQGLVIKIKPCKLN